MARYSPTSVSRVVLLTALGAVCAGSMLFGAYKTALEPLRLTRIATDVFAWLSCTVVCIMLGNLAWKLRHRFPFKLAACGLVVLVIGCALKRAMDTWQLQYGTNHLNPSMEAWSIAGSILITCSVLLLIPFLRKIHDYDAGDNEDRARFLAAAEANASAFCLLEPVRNSMRQIVDFAFTFANQGAQRLFQMAPEDISGTHITMLLPHLRESGMLDRLKEVAQTGVAYSGETKDKTPDGAVIYCSLQARKAQGDLSLVLHDLVEERGRQKHVEDLNRLSTSIIQDAPFSIIATDANGMITAINSATEQLTGYRRHELVGKHSIVALHDPAELSSRAMQLSQSLGEPVIAGFQTLTASLRRRKSNESEWNYVRSDGRRVAVHLAMTVLRGSDGEITGYLAVAFDVSERKKLNDSISFLAHHDALTKLPNRMLLNERLRHAIERAKALDQQVAVFMVDIDHFKRINDSLGHWAGDQLLVEVSERLLTAVRKTDTVARVGGDEFIVLMPNSGSVEDAHMCANRILSKLQPPVVIAGREVNVTASVGLCIYPEWGGDPVSLLRNADAAMYAAKQHGRNHFESFSGNMLEATSDRLEIEADLRNAVKNGQMFVAYQPQVDCRSGDIVGVEALLRWKHPTRGMISPVEFIPIAEESGLILPIGQWALRRACVEIKRLQEITGRNITLAANLSPRQFQQRDLAQIVESALAESGLDAAHLELEITESTMMVSSTDTMAGLSRVRELGVRVAIDDFGTGFSNFTYILDYKVDRLKIDRSFTAKCTTDASASAVIRTIIAMAHGLGIKVVAEGVETEEELKFLVRRRCDEIQGFLFGRPVPIDEIIQKVHTWQPMAQSQRVPAATYTKLLSAKGSGTRRAVVSKPM